ANSRYQVQIHHLIYVEDLPELSTQLERIFHVISEEILPKYPFGCEEFPSHILHGLLSGWNAVGFTYDDIAYRLVYRVYDSPPPKRVFIISFAEHDPAYERATSRAATKKSRSRPSIKNRNKKKL
ncbi:MAG: hypothetical protein VKJ46_01200, partial [Leptolyngbyaceae bacterium]|nr:hypothetical protein [Leptolyngbyaceae bacterium]